MIALRNITTGRMVASAVETALDRRSRRRGLLGRNGLADGQALLLAPCAAIHTCFMRFPVDVLFVDRVGTVRGMQQNLGAWRVAASLGAWAVIELPAGTIARSGTSLGDRVALVASGTAACDAAHLRLFDDNNGGWSGGCHVRVA